MGPRFCNARRVAVMPRTLAAEERVRLRQQPLALGLGMAPDDARLGAEPRALPLREPPRREHASRRARRRGRRARRRTRASRGSRRCAQAGASSAEPRARERAHLVDEARREHRVGARRDARVELGAGTASPITSASYGALREAVRRLPGGQAAARSRARPRARARCAPRRSDGCAPRRRDRRRASRRCSAGDALGAPPARCSAARSAGTRGGAGTEAAQQRAQVEPRAADDEHRAGRARAMSAIAAAAASRKRAASKGSSGSTRSRQ